MNKVIVSGWEVNLKIRLLGACLALMVTATQAKSLNCQRVIVTSGHHAYLADDMFGPRAFEVRGLQSLAEGAYSYEQDLARRAAARGGRACVAEAGDALLGGLLVGAGAAVVLGLAGGVALFNPSGASWIEQGGGALIGALAGAALGYPFGCGLGTTMAGRATYADGNNGGAYGGAYAGMAMGVLAGLISRRWEVGYLAAGVLSPTGAVIGYNTGAPRSESKNSVGARLAPPTLALCTRQSPDRQRYSVFDCRLVMVRF